ncbi:11S globulin precursor [Tanacetum coccineum]
MATTTTAIGILSIVDICSHLCDNLGNDVLKLLSYDSSYVGLITTFQVVWNVRVDLLEDYLITAISCRINKKYEASQDALLSRHWSINSRTIIYVLSGDGQVQVVSNNDVNLQSGEVVVVGKK